MTFDLQALKKLLEQAQDGRLQVPEFQRKLTLTDDWITSLLASVSLGHPIGAVMLLQAGSPDLRFTTSPILGARSSATEPEWLLLDGQRRITALYQALASGQAVQIHEDPEEPTSRWYYLDIEAALDPETDRDQALISVPETRQVRTPQEVMVDLSTTESEWERRLFPLRLVFGDGAERRRWRSGFVEHAALEDAGARDQLMSRFDAEVLQAFDAYLLPTITVGRETTRWAVRVHGGPDGRSLSDRFRARDPR